MGTRVAGAAWRVCVAALVVALPIAATASAGAVTATSPSPAPTAASCYTPALFAYDAASYVYDGPARLSSPDTVATDARSSPSRPEVGSWEGAASVRDRGVAADTADDVARLADDAVVVRGGTSDVPPAGEVFSGAYGQTLEEAGAFVPYGQLRATTAGEIRLGGGTVDVVPEMTRGGNLNPNHVNICLGPGSCPFGPLIPNPVPKPGRIQ